MSRSDLLQYDAPQSLYGIAFSSSSQHPHRVALTSYVTGPSNKLYVADVSSPHHNAQSPIAYAPASDFQQLASVGLSLPATKVGWEPPSAGSLGGKEEQGGRGELLVTAGDMLRLWELQSAGDERGRGYVGANGYGANGNGYTLATRSVLTNSKAPAVSLPPITSFSWNETSPKSIVTCSIDTTATLWDINTSQAVTQLIAHDRAVYDLSWLPKSSDIFVSVGADGSLRAFDLRTLEHSTILYESPNEAPLARIAFSNKEQHMLACFATDENKVLILDMRSPGHPVAELVGHKAALNAIAWGSAGDGSGPTGGGWIASCGDDAQLLLYDLSSPLPESRPSSTRPGAKSSNSNHMPHSGLSPDPSTASPYSALSPPSTPGHKRNTPSPSQALEVLPAKAWTAAGEINNMAFAAEGEWLGCVSGSRLSVLRV